MSCGDGDGAGGLAGLRGECGCRAGLVDLVLAVPERDEVHDHGGGARGRADHLYHDR
eukprot:COSAG02_NODE_490_length_21240_cov_7.601343_11_plen_57_part_00